jgi:hypothetical protein
MPKGTSIPHARQNDAVGQYYGRRHPRASKQILIFDNYFSGKDNSVITKKQNHCREIIIGGAFQNVGFYILVFPIFNHTIR